ncbi:LamG domain-containing protein [Flavobacteriaceae bacterium AU392]|nr:LamG domain-containing protein [Flavobacteriaceae bacterium]RKM85956.1 LamG domain-containing protein [Flavobacteriaceae bacterium AU392]
MINKIIGMKKASMLLIFFTTKFLLFSTVTMGQYLYTGVSDQNKTGSKWISSDGLVASYDFETYTSTGLLKDFGPFENHGKTLRNLDTLGFFGKARMFSTLADIVVLPDHKNFDLDGPITVAVWMKVSTLNLHQHILACSDKFVLWTTGKNQFRFADTRGNGFTTLEGTVEADGWHSIIAVWSGAKGDTLSKNNIKIFIDGVQMDGTFENNWKPDTMLAKNACVIGSTLHGAKGHQKLPFEGAIDEIQLFSRALNVDEIKIHATK